MDRGNTYRVMVTVRVTDAEYNGNVSFDGSVEVDVSELDDLGYIASNIASPLGRSAGAAMMRSVRMVRLEAQPELITE